MKVEALLPFPSLLLRRLLRPEQQPDTGGTGPEPQRLGGQWSQTSVCGTEACVLQPAEALVSQN